MIESAAANRDASRLKAVKHCKWRKPIGIKAARKARLLSDFLLGCVNHRDPV